MARFFVKLHGENVLLSLDGEHGKFSFNVSRLIRAQSPDEAGRIAIIQVHQHLNQNEHVVKTLPDPPKIRIVSIEKISALRLLTNKWNLDFDFFPEADRISGGEPG